jgi:hypothetical protein
MYNLFPKKPPQQKTQRKTTPADENFIPFLISAVLFFGLVSASLPTTPRVGDMLTFKGGMPPVAAGSTNLNASVVKDIWGSGAESCRIDVKAMALAHGTAEVVAVNNNKLILQWHAASNAQPIGCPSAPALLALGVDEYQHMVALNQASGHLYFRG